jgi:hypothetical protein
VRLRQHLLEHERVDIDHAVLQQMQRQHAHLVILTVVAHEFTAAGEEDEVIGAIPLLDHIQIFVDLAAQCFAMKIVA